MDLDFWTAAAVREMLDDQASVLEPAQKTDIDSGQIDQVLHAARTWSHRLRAEAEQTVTLAALVERVELKCDGMGVSIKLPIASTETSRAQLSHVSLSPRPETFRTTDGKAHPSAFEKA
jgi:hypothetical protein